MNYLDRVVLVHPFLAHFQSVSLFLTIGQDGMGTKLFSQILKKKNGVRKTIYLLHNDNIVSRGLQRTIRKIGNILTVYL